MFTALDVIKTTGVFLAIDLVYLGIIQRSNMVRFFRNVNCGKSYNIRPAAVLTWLLLGYATERFVLQMAKNRYNAAYTGALLGALIYGVYDLTNYGTIKAWTFSFVVSDVLWGSLLGAIVAAIRFRDK